MHCCLQNGEYAVEEVRGMQEGDDPKWPLKIHATLKQYAPMLPASLWICATPNVHIVTDTRA